MVVEQHCKEPVNQWTIGGHCSKEVLETETAVVMRRTRTLPQIS